MKKLYFQNDKEPKGSIMLKEVVPYICVGMLTDKMPGENFVKKNKTSNVPVRRPQVPESYSVHHLVGIATDPKASTVHWFLFKVCQPCIKQSANRTTWTLNHGSIKSPRHCQNPTHRLLKNNLNLQPQPKVLLHRPIIVSP